MKKKYIKLLLSQKKFSKKNNLYQVLQVFHELKKRNRGKLTLIDIVSMSVFGRTFGTFFLFFL